MSMPAQGLGPAPQLTPPRTVGAVVRQARDALRRYREATAPRRRAPGTQQERPQQEQQQEQPLLQDCECLSLCLPLPVTSASPPGTPLLEQPFSVFDEGDWPGGIVQRFRVLRPLVDATLDGYGASFLGMLEDPADGLGCWALDGGATVAAGIPTNATFASFAKLARGGYGARPLRGGTLLAVNPEWTSAADIGQPWDRQLKADAQQVLGGRWSVLYSAKMVRTARGRGYGLLVGSWGSGWALWPASADDSASVREPYVLASETEPEAAQVVEALNTAAAEAGGTQRGLQQLLNSLWQRPRDGR